MAFIPQPPRTPFFEWRTGPLAQFRKLFAPGPTWWAWFDQTTRNLNSFFTELEQVGGIQGLPFQGVLGSGRHGSVHITGNTTATEEIPIYQLTNLTVDAGVTWTAYASNPGGFIISVKGRCTIDGTITAQGRGGTGGSSVTADGTGKNGKPGFNIAGSGGGGGAATDGGAVDNGGGHGAPCKSGFPINGWSPGDIARVAAEVSWFGDNTGATNNQVRQMSGGVSNPGGAGAFNFAAGAGASGGAVSGLTGYGLPDLFLMLWAMYPGQIYGWGGGGGSGALASGSTGSSGAGGNGGGCVIILCDELDFTGTINVGGTNGGNGSVSGGNKGAGGGGGGAGGLCLLGYRTLIANTGTINSGAGTNGTGANTGIGGATNGGVGGNGYSRVFNIRL